MDAATLTDTASVLKAQAVAAAEGRPARSLLYFAIRLALDAGHCWPPIPAPSNSSIRPS